MDADWGAERADSHSLTTTSITADLVFNHIAVETAWITRGIGLPALADGESTLFVEAGPSVTASFSRFGIK
ncbi:hypothetical protein ACFIOY_26510 [Bradyrhizobium sp. TZ2]